MADKKISQLPAGAVLVGDELLEMTQAGASFRTTAQEIADLAGSFNPSSPTTIIESWRSIDPTFARGATAYEPVFNFGSFFDNGSLVGSVNAASGSANNLLARITSRRQAFFTAFASPGSNTLAGQQYSGPQNQFRRMSGTPTPAGGLFLYSRFGFSYNTVATNSGRYFNGFVPTITFTPSFAGSDGAFDAMVNVMGIGKYDTDANLQFIVNDGSGAISKVDTGLAFTAALDKLLELYIYSDYSSDSVTIVLRVVDTGVVLSHTFTTNLPALSVPLYWIFIGNNGYHQDVDDKAVYLYWPNIVINPGF